MNIFNGAHVLVTGGAGFVGSHLTKALLAKGAHVTVVDNLSTGKRSRLPSASRLEVRLVNLKNRYLCEKLVKGKDYVFHFAANMGGIGFITKVGADVMRDNLTMNINMLETSVKFSVKRLFYSSSACVYPIHKQESLQSTALKEQDAIPAQPDTFYGWEKLVTEKMCEAYAKDYGLEVRVARFHNVYGPGASYDDERGKVIACLCRKAINYPEERFVVWGDGKQQRSFLYIDDAVDAILRLMESNYNQPLNIGTDRLISISDLAKMIVQISGKRIPIEYDLSKPQGVRSRNADVTLAKKVLDWQPKVSLEEGLQKTYQWASVKAF